LGRHRNYMASEINAELACHLLRENELNHRQTAD
jgi:hypothetical protein